jgi:Protein of unknown function (DUF993)
MMTDTRPGSGSVPCPVPRMALTASIPSRIEAVSACACGRKARPASVRVALTPVASARSLPHLAEVFRLADNAGLLPDRDLSVRRMSALLAQYEIVN